jgi:hypothetical protein
MRKVAIGITGAVALLLAGMLAGYAEAAPLTGCCHVAGAWLCGSPPLSFGSVSPSEVLQAVR